MNTNELKRKAEALSKDFTIDKLNAFFHERFDGGYVKPAPRDHYLDDRLLKELKLNKPDARFEPPELICQRTMSDNYVFPVFFFRLKNGILNERSCRKDQFSLAKNMLDLAQDHQSIFQLNGFPSHAIFVFADRNKHFRLSLIENLDRNQKRYRRYTFYVDPEATNRTFIDRMSMNWDSFADIKEAFSVERLNKEFYSKLSNWYFWALTKVQFPGCEQTKEGNAVPLIRLITRIIFVWFMKQKKLIPNELFQKNHVEKMLNDMAGDSSSYYKAILQNLFFATLNTEMKDSNSRRFRMVNNGSGYCYEKMFASEGKKTFLDLMRNIPFLNGGLFSCLDDGRNLVDCFSDNPNHASQLTVPNELFWTEESDNKRMNLSRIYDDKSKKNELLQGLVPLLSQYNFTIDESSPNDATIALDPELLGRVFENLLASYNPETKTTARKQSGSFYTPREIVDYMVEQSLTRHILTAAEKQGIPLSEEDVQTLVSPDDTALPQSIVQNKKMIVKAIESCTILDPACGSGAFPMGLLSAFVRVLGKLDPVKTDTELYERKLKLIQNCIYGVDIQPIAVQISKLRCFISLLADDDIDDNEENRGIEPLPNLEMHFVAANSLIDLEGPQDGSFISPKTEKIKDEMQDTARKLFSVKSRADKKKLQQKYTDGRQKFVDSLSSDFNTHDYDKLADWDPFDPTKFSPFFNPEWMFGIKGGFDIVIGNPPYVFARDSKKKGISPQEKAVFKKNYVLAQYQINLYSLFIERGTNLLSHKGAFSYIVPNNWLTINTNKELRKFVLSKDSITIVNFYKRVFESAHVDSSIIVFRNTTNPEAITSLYEVTDEKQIHLIKIEPAAFFLNQKDYIINIGVLKDDAYFKLIDRIEKASNKLSSCASVYAALQAYEVGKGTPEQTEKMKESRVYHAKYQIDNTYLKYIDGEDVKRYSFSWVRQEFLKYGKNLAAPRKFKLFSSPRILVRQIPSKPPYCICANFAEETFLNDRNSMNVIDFEVDPLFILGVLNSKVISFWFIHKFGKMQRNTFPQFKVNELKVFPIPCYSQGNNEFYQKIKGLVDSILQQKAANPQADTSKLEAEIDRIVYLLYGLTEEEKEIIEQTLAKPAAESKKKGKGSAGAAGKNEAKQEKADDQNDSGAFE